MSSRDEKENSQEMHSSEGFEPAPELIIENLDAIKLLNHEKSSRILEILIEEELTIIDIKRITEWNPGTIKRHLTELVKAGLVVITKEIVNKFQITMKYYRTTAKSFIIQWRWSPNKTKS